MSQRQTEEDVVDELAEEFARRLRAGERPSVEEFAARHPDRAEEIREVLLAVEMMERLKPRPEDTPAAQQPRPAERIPERIGEYRIVREIGRGGMGVVYEAEQEALGRRVALKVLPAHLVADEKARARFRRESQAAARLHHTNVVPVFGAGESGGLCFYVMQLIEGRSLDHLIRAAASYSGAPTDTSPWGKRPASAAPTDPATQEEAPAENLSLDGPILLDVRAAARIAEQAADALHYAHSQGVLHRDVKPSNLLLDARGTVWVTDFGVAKLAEEARLTLSGDLVGTLKYVPPERFSGHTDARGDTYSLGVTLYEMLTLRSAFPDTNAQHLIHLITTQTPDPPRVRNPAVPSDLETIVLKAVARDPDQRYQTAAQFAEDLRRFLDDRPILARRAGPAERAWRWCRRNPSLAVAGAAILILMAAVTVVSLAGYLRVSAANERTKETLAAEKAQREHAEETASLALAALNRTFDQFAPARLVATPPASADGVELPPASLPPDAIGLLEDLLRTYEQVARAGGEYPRLQAQAAEAYHRIGDVHQRLGRHEQAAAAYRAAIELYDHLPDDQVTDATPVKLARSRNELGRVLRTLRKLDEAERAHRLAIQTLTDLPRAAASRPECRFELARSYYLLGLRDFLDGPGGKGPRGEKREPPHKKGDRNGHDRPPPPPDEPADAPGRKAAELLEELVREFPKMPEYRHLLACCYRDVPPAPPRGRPDGKPKPDRAVDLLRALAADFPRVPDYRLDLCDALARHVPPGHGEQPADREKRMREAIGLASELAAQYPNVPEYAAAQARYLDLLGFDLFESGKPSDAEKLHRQAIAIQVKLVRQYPGVVAYEFWLFLMERSLGRSLSEGGELKEAKTYQQSAIDRAEKLRKSDPNLKGVRPVLGMAYRELAQTLTRAGDSAGADRARRAAEEFGGDRPDGPGGPKKRGGQRR